MKADKVMVKAYYRKGIQMKSAKGTAQGRAHGGSKQTLLMALCGAMDDA